MTQDDFAAFALAWGAAAEMQSGKELSDRAIKMAYAMLTELDLQEVKDALRSHCRKNRWMATPSDVLACAHGEMPSKTELYGRAVDGDTILGRFIQSHTGGDLKRLSVRDGIQRIEMLSGVIEQFWQRALVGDYTDRELRMLMAAYIDPTTQLASGVSGPRPQYRAEVRRRAEALKPEPQIEHKAPPEPELTDEQREANKAAMRKAMQELATSFGKPLPEAQA